MDINKALMESIKKDDAKTFLQIMSQVNWGTLDNEPAFNMAAAAEAYGAKRISQFIRGKQHFKKSVDIKPEYFSSKATQLREYCVTGDLGVIMASEKDGVDFHFFSDDYFRIAVRYHQHDLYQYLFGINPVLIRKNPYLIRDVVFFDLEREPQWPIEEDILEQITALQKTISLLIALGFDINHVYEHRITGSIRKNQTALDAALAWLHYSNPQAGKIVLHLAEHAALTYAEIQDDSLLTPDALRKRRRTKLQELNTTFQAFYQKIQAYLELYERRIQDPNIPNHTKSYYDRSLFLEHIEKLLLVENAFNYEADMLEQRLDRSSTGEVPHLAKTLYTEIKNLGAQRPGFLKRLLELGEQESRLGVLWLAPAKYSPVEPEDTKRLACYKDLLTQGLDTESQIQRLLEVLGNADND